MRVVCEPIGPVVAGDPAIVRVTSVNDGATAVEWPIRLHPSESTVSFVIDGELRRGVEQIDSIVETVTLEAGDAVSTGVAVPLDVGGSATEISLQLAVRPPGAGPEVLSNECRIVVVGSNSSDRGAPVAALDDLAWTVRNGDDAADRSAVASALESFPEPERSWVATALLPAAPLPDDVLLVVATDLAADRSEAQTPAWVEMAEAVLEGRPHQAPDLD